MDNKVLAMILTIRMGFYIQATHPEVAERYLAGDKVREIASDLMLEESFAVKPVTVENAVRIALRGNDKNIYRVAIYGGLIPEDKYLELSKKNRQESARNARERGLEKGVGLHQLSANEKRANAQKAAISRGETPWTEEHIRRAAYLKLTGYNNVEIANDLNNYFYAGKQVRNRNMVQTMFYREKKRATKVS